MSCLPIVRSLLSVSSNLLSTSSPPSHHFSRFLLFPFFLKLILIPLWAIGASILTLLIILFFDSFMYAASHLNFTLILHILHLFLFLFLSPFLFLSLSFSISISISISFFHWIPSGMVNVGYEKSKELKKEESKEDLRNIRTLHLKIRYGNIRNYMLLKNTYHQ